MKKVLLGIAVALSIILIRQWNYNGYIGTYCCEGNSNVSIKLNSDDSFELIRESNRNSEVFDGKYHIDDNKVNFEFDSKNNKETFNGLTKGKFYGNILVIENEKKSLNFKKM